MSQSHIYYALIRNRKTTDVWLRRYTLLAGGLKSYIYRPKIAPVRKYGRGEVRKCPYIKYKKRQSEVDKQDGGTLTKPSEPIT